MNISFCELTSFFLLISTKNIDNKINSKKRRKCNNNNNITIVTKDNESYPPWVEDIIKYILLILGYEV